MTTAVATNYKKNDVPVPAKWMDGLPSCTGVTSVKKSAKEGKLWKEMQNLKITRGLAAGAGANLMVGQQVKVDDNMWVIVDPNNPQVIEVAMYAVITANQQSGTNLQFEKVNFGLKKTYTIPTPVAVVDIDCYVLMIQTDGGIYGALVVVGPFDVKVLLEFAKLPISPSN